MISHDDKLPTFGKAADGKPENVSNGHLHTEIDTGKKYRYSEADDEWYEQPASGGGGSSLPAVTSDDNGDVLTVVEGAWAKAAAPVPSVETTDKDKYLHTNASTGDLEWSEVAAGGGFLFVTLTATLNSTFEPSAFASDKTYSEIASAIAAGIPVLASAKMSATGNYLGVSPVNRVYDSAFVFTTVVPFNSLKYKVTINSNNTITFSNYVDINDPVKMNYNFSTSGYQPEGTGWYVKDYAQPSKASAVFALGPVTSSFGVTEYEYADIVYAYSQNAMGTIQYEVRIKGRSSGSIYTTGVVTSDGAPLSFVPYTP